MRTRMRRMIGTVVATASLALLFQISTLAAAPPAATVFTMSNDPGGNTVLVFYFDGNRLSAGPVVPTGGLGTGGIEPDLGLANAHAVQLSEDNKFLLVVNPGSNDISVLAFTPRGLRLVERVDSGGQQPVSVAAKKGLVYVLNAGGNVGGTDNIVGFTLSRSGHLKQLCDSTRPLSSAVTGPAQIQFAPSGDVLVVTEKTTNFIDTYTIGADGVATGPTVTVADAPTPFGFDFANRNQLFLSNDVNDAAGAGSLSSYTVDDDGILHLVSPAVNSHETGACWVAVDNGGRYAILANTVSSTISVYSIRREDGSVSLLRSVPSHFAPIDVAFSRDGRYFFALNSSLGFPGTPGINVWAYHDGNLSGLTGASGLPTSVDGLAVR